IERFSHLYASGDFPHTLGFDAQVERAGIPSEHPRAAAVGKLFRAIHGLPRHLGQHSGGMIICQGQLDSIVPLENASMPGRVVAIIRPGPIQGHLMHPYLKRRAGKEPVTYYADDLKPVLERTLGVPLFQEQMLRIAMVMADFSGNEAEELRRALSFHRSQERMQKVSVKLREAMARKNIAPDKIEKIIQSISSFALYGFPESHAISFAILAYGSAYLKVHRAPEFYASLLNNQPMGFYTPATIVKDAQRHGVKIKP